MVDIQYSMVDNKRSMVVLFLSRKAGNSHNFAFGIFSPTDYTDLKDFNFSFIRFARFRLRLKHNSMDLHRFLPNGIYISLIFFLPTDDLFLTDGLVSHG